MLPPGSPEPVQEIALPLDFKGVAACLWRDPSPTAAIKAPMEPMQLKMMAEPAVAMMCTSCIVQDETMGVTYMDMVTTSVGRVALRSSYMAVHPPRSTIEDVTDLP